MARRVADTFDPTEVAVVTGGPDEGAAFTRAAFDHIIFTGSPDVGSKVMAAAAERLTPVTLELAGKNPAILTDGFDLEEAAHRVMAIKGFNAGQICLESDYVLVPRGRERAFAEACVAATRELFPDGVASPDYTSIMTDHHYDRLVDVIEDAREKGAEVEGDPVAGVADIDELVFADGHMARASAPSTSFPIVEIMRAAGLDTIEQEATASAGISDLVSQARKSRNTHGAIFCEVKVDEELDQVRVTRIVIAVAAGRIINPTTARSQILGGVVMGIGMALHEESVMDTGLGRWINHSLVEYHVPAHADISDIEVIFVDEPDPEVTPLGVKGLGEIGTVGTAAAVANAIFHATGKRVRSLPVTVDKIMTAQCRSRAGSETRGADTPGKRHD